MEDQQRLWLMFPARLITEPVVWELGHKFKIVTNVRQASVTDEIGIVSSVVELPRIPRVEKRSPRTHMGTA